MQKCLDYYNEPLKIGDMVIPIIIGEKIVNAKGIITHIYYNPEDNGYYLNIKSEDGYLFFQRKEQDYTTRERYEKYNPTQYTYFLDLDYVAPGRYEKILDAKSSLMFDFPYHSFMAVLYARYKTKNFDRYEFIPKFGFILDKDVTINKENDQELPYFAARIDDITKFQ